jgi:uncharacterized protein (DUF697 family)
MARRSSTIGHDPLQAMGADRPSPKATRRAAPRPQPVAVVATAAPAPQHEAEALKIVRSYCGWSAVAGLVPVPGLDLAAIIGVQVKMLGKLAELYHVPFDAKMVRPLIVTLVSGGSGWLLGGLTANLIKAIGGFALALIAQPPMASASCWATGRVFIMHFESGGTLLDFDPAKMRAYYVEHFGSAHAGA